MKGAFRYKRKNTTMFAIDVARDVLYDKINRRVDIMMDMGLVDEVKSIVEMGIGKATKHLTQFSVSQANALFKKWKELDEYLLIKYITYMIWAAAKNPIWPINCPQEPI